MFELQLEGHSSRLSKGPTIALIPAGGALWDDFLDSIGVSLEKFCSEGPGGWQRGYINGLLLCGLRTVLIFFSARISSPVRYRHHPSGTTIVVLPAPATYHALRRKLSREAGRAIKSPGLVRRNVFRAIRQVAPYLSTPIRALVRELRRERCLAIICQEYEHFRFDTCVLLGKFIGLPVFATFQGMDFDPNLVGRALRPLTIRSSAGLLIASQTEIKRVRTQYNLPTTRILQVFNPVDVEVWSAVDRNEARALLDLPPDARIAVWHGRVEIESKGLDVLLEAWQQISWERPGEKLYLVLMGTGQNAAQLQHRLDAMCMRNVRWINEYVTDGDAIRRLLSAGDVYAFPSRHEGFAVAPIEAMACGLPVVAADAHGVPDIFISGESSGGIVVPRDNPTEFARALIRVLTDRGLAQEIGRHARSRVEEAFSLEAIGKQLRTVLRNTRIPVSNHAWAEPLGRVIR
jgi:starch synthase